LNEFFQKSRDLFPDAVFKLGSTFDCGDHVIAEWKLSATEIVPYGSVYLQLPISVQGASVVRIENGRVTRWSDYYDQLTSRRVRLTPFFSDWMEY
jgi:hypothetical protein